jgi:hypothetical protein
MFVWVNACQICPRFRRYDYGPCIWEYRKWLAITEYTFVDFAKSFHTTSPGGSRKVCNAARHENLCPFPHNRTMASTTASWTSHACALESATKGLGSVSACSDLFCIATGQRRPCVLGWLDFKKYKNMTLFIHYYPPFRKRAPRYPLDSRLGGHQSRSGVRPNSIKYVRGPGRHKIFYLLHIVHIGSGAVTVDI